MVRLKYNGIEVRVPEDWGDITLGFYETFCMERPQTARDQVALVATICKVETELLLSWPAEVFNCIVDYISFLFRDNPAGPVPCVEANGAKFLVAIEEELTLGEWVDVDDVQKRKENVLSNTLAIVCRPAGEKYNCENNAERQKMFASLPVSSVLGVLAFFLQCETVLEKRTEAFLNLAQALDRLPRDIKLSPVRGGGIKLLQTWRIIKYRALIALLNYRLRKFSRSYSTVRTGSMQKKRRGN